MKLYHIADLLYLGVQIVVFLISKLQKYETEIDNNPVQKDCLTLNSKMFSM